MATVLQPWQILVAAMAGWITRQQDSVIDYLREENHVLKQQIGRRRLRLTDTQRRRLAVRGKAIGRRAGLYCPAGPDRVDQPGIVDVSSGAPGTASDGTLFSEW